MPIPMELGMEEVANGPGTCVRRSLCDLGGIRGTLGTEPIELADSPFLSGWH